ncbi:MULTISPECIES: GAP family protein [unclassified Streptomyces]|uniref:GAP family protein n=1 Tax=unclassified Streptomyces TaxID=2593676 RepID=UPI002258C0CD|nr:MULTISPECIES: GAP family protein [unclassified Streptomyces]MCX4529604.1 GAP family protein [Streptomyces sp. NBC_01551]MCX4539823.1 GAP family protein [Streptomyces sp. NBC_01565]
MVLDLMLIALAIALYPLPMMAFILVVSSARGVWKGLAFLLAWLACLVAVIAIVLALTGGEPPAPRSPPSVAALAVKLAIGVALVIYGVRRYRRRLARSRAPGATEARDPKPSRVDVGSAWAAAGLAVLLQPWGMVAAGATTVIQADTSHATTYIALLGFCLLASSGLLAAELYMVFAPEAAQARLLRMRTWMEGHKDEAIVFVCLLLGLWLTAQSIYELTG